MKLFTSKLLLTYLIFCISFCLQIALSDSFLPFFQKTIRSNNPIPEEKLFELDKDVKEALESKPTDTKLKKLQDSIKYATWLIARNIDNESRSESDQKTIDKALKKVSNNLNNLSKDWRKNVKSAGKFGAAAVAGGAALAYGKDKIEEWWASRGSDKPAKKPGNKETGGGSVPKINMPSNALIGGNKGGSPPKTAESDSFPWTWVILGGLVVVAIALVVYLNQDSLFGDGNEAAGYGEEDGYADDDEPTRKMKKGKRRGSKNKKRKRRHSI